MGKATIKQNLGDGRYLVDMALNAGLKEPALAKLSAIIAGNEARLPEIQAALDKQVAKTTGLIAEQSGIIDEIKAFQDNYNDTKATLTASLSSADDAVEAAQAEVDDAGYNLDSTKNELAGFEAEKARIESLPPPGNVPNPDLLLAIAQTQANIAMAEEDLASKKADLSAAQKTRDGIKSQLDGLNDEIPKEMLDRMSAAIAAIQSSQYAESLYRVGHAQTRMDIQAAKLEKSALEKIPTTKEMAIWCIDYTPDLTGEVATVDIPGETGSIPTLIKPGFTPTPYDRHVDGDMVSLEMMTPEQSWFNLCILPYIDKFRPGHRRAHITEIIGETCTVELEETFTKYHRIEVTPKGKRTIQKVPVAYMECNVDAFEVGDLVIVEFTNRDPESPKVIGFAENPRGCNFHGFGVTKTDGIWLIQKKNAAWTIKRRDSMKYGTLYRKLKILDKWTVVSFNGPPDGVMLGTIPGWTGDMDAFTVAEIYANGRTLAAPGKVEGLGLCEITGVPWVYIVADHSIHRAPIPEKVDSRTVLAWEDMGSYGPPYEFNAWVINNPEWVGETRQSSMWEFNRDCTEVAAVFGAVGGAATLTGVWTVAGLLSLEWQDATAGSVLESATVSLYSLRDNAYFDATGYYHSTTKLVTLVWAGYVIDGFALDKIYFDMTNDMQTPYEWGGYMDYSGSIIGPIPYFMHDAPEGSSTRQGFVEYTNNLMLNGSVIYAYQHGMDDVVTRRTLLTYLDPGVMAYGVVGYDGSTPICDLLKDNAVILSGDNLYKYSNPPDYSHFATVDAVFKHINNDAAYGKIDTNHFQVIEDTDGNLLACIYDFSEVHDAYNNFIYGYTKAALLTGGDIHALAGAFSTLMPIGLI